MIVGIEVGWVIAERFIAVLCSFVTGFAVHSEADLQTVAFLVSDHGLNLWVV